MANRNKIATQIAKGLPGGFIAFKGMAYRPQFSFVARGILIEGTPDKDTNYVWHLRLPFFLPRTHVGLN